MGEFTGRPRRPLLRCVISFSNQRWVKVDGRAADADCREQREEQEAGPFHVLWLRERKPAMDMVLGVTIWSAA